MTLEIAHRPSFHTGICGSALVPRDKPQTAVEKDDCRRRCQRATDRSRLRRKIQAHQAPCSVAFGVPWGRKEGV